MRPLPKACCNGKRIDPLIFPPNAFVASPVQFTMVQPADGNGEFVADLPPHRPLLGKFDVMGVRRAPPTDEARLRGHKSQMVAIALAYRLADGKDPVAGAPRF